MCSASTALRLEIGAYNVIYSTFATAIAHEGGSTLAQCQTMQHPTPHSHAACTHAATLLLLLRSYNAVMNSPDRKHYNACYGQYTLHRFPADAIMTLEDYLHIDERDYLAPKDNPNIKAAEARH